MSITVLVIGGDEPFFDLLARLDLDVDAHVLLACDQDEATEVLRVFRVDVVLTADTLLALAPSQLRQLLLDPPAVVSECC